ncbi:hypothetical protein ACFQMA_07045 [Halosimplex aquaticum]|uniref:Sec-independent protein translocase protein TatA n=1 Tax=Halosimplex aquaticum TaxID=3026162 RepID=A0ABD5XX17_9EURY|nr:preprotein translocase subunit TatA [Halosimplex aquaticum]
MTVPLQIPGATELLIVLMVFAFFVGIAGGIVFLVRRFGDSGKDQRIDELEQQVEELREERDS